MAQSEGAEYYRIKAFLYKYVPDFTRSFRKDKRNLAKIDRYNIELNEQKFFYKFDISDFVSSYDFDQSINENTYSWSMVLQDKVLTLSEINSRIKVEGPLFTTQITANSLVNVLAKYEAQAANISDFPIIRTAKLNRGKTQDPLSVRAGSNLTTTTGVMLSDLVQMYDMVSVFLYRGEVPLSEIVGTVTTDATSGQKVFTIGTVGKALSEADMKQESILLTQTGKNPPKTLFANDINGFIMKKSVTTRINGVDTINISGNGISRLFGSTRKVIKSSLLQESIYDIGEIVNPAEATFFQNVYVGKTMEQIFQDLFNLVYRIRFKTLKTTIEKDVTTVTGQVVTIQEPTQQPTNENFYDISYLMVGNQYQTNLFSIPPFLLSLVMKRHGFRYREPRAQNGSNTASFNQLVLQTQASAVRASVLDSTKQRVDQNSITQTLDTQLGLQTVGKGKSPVYFSTELNQLRGYFKFIEDVFRFFNPELKTPFQIIDELREKTFLEFLERSDGTLIIRPPQYNDVANVIFSSSLSVISATYNDTVENLIARQTVGYGTDIIGEIEAIKEYAFTNGKLLLQFGFMEAGADINPNVKNDKLDSSDTNQRKDSGLFKYAEYFLRLHNASLKTATLNLSYDARISVGRTYFDEKANKFGYIVGVSKSVNPAGNAVMTISLSYVRDAYLATPNARIGSNIVFEKLDRLVDIAAKFSSTSVDTTVSDAEPQ